MATTNAIDIGALQHRGDGGAEAAKTSYLDIGAAQTADAVLLAFPRSDVSAGNWTPSAGLSLFAMVSDQPDDDTRYITSDATVGADACELGFGALQTPSGGVTLKLRHRQGA